jgi:hypothetical protein
VPLAQGLMGGALLGADRVVQAGRVSLPGHPGFVYPLSHNERGETCGAALLLPESRVHVGFRWQRFSGLAQEAGGRPYGSGLYADPAVGTTGGLTRHLDAFRSLGKENTLCIPYVACHGLSP